jgi:hypothetical protein
MKKIFILLSFLSLVLSIISCKKIETLPKYVHPFYDSRNKISVEINGEIENSFEFYSSIAFFSERQYDTIPFPRYFDCPNTKEFVTIIFPKEISSDIMGILDIEKFHPFIGIKQKPKISPLPPSIISPKNGCDYDTTFRVDNSYILEGDISGVAYKVNDKEKNDLTITSYDRVSGKMTGEFNLTFDHLNPAIANKEFPQKLEYRNGKFTVYVKKSK